mgnify:CR=1 FL=1
MYQRGNLLFTDISVEESGTNSLGGNSICVTGSRNETDSGHKCWEVMLMGQIGTGGTANVSMDSSLILSGGEFDSNLSDYVKVVTGGDATCGIKSDGSL